ncbi:uncharacterized GPI-anchored protein At1g61900 isoform X2 [Cryptomeria japonica]|uniref:uncharacterized GPI-anchored protein At1g61900 isoform X2 n=1 Tax=Cryptomeria japonica TaxID=3369 RepID=UPI0025AC40AA|nr:uncharacterized GPI-anchored protein At1g61900 isoform X2 [Cryptomeria japonica]
MLVFFRGVAQMMATLLIPHGVFYLWFVISFMCVKEFELGTVVGIPISSPPVSVYATAPSDIPSDLFGPIQISPTVVPREMPPAMPMPPMYPYFPTAPNPVLTGKCPVNISAFTQTVDLTAADCSAPLATYLGNVICCPQVHSMLRIFQGKQSLASGSLVLNITIAKYCLKDIVSVLTSSGANNTISTLCSVKPSNLTGGSCPVKDVINFEQIVNTSKLLDACRSVDPLKECCRPVCEPAIVEAAVHLASRDWSSLAKNAALASPAEQVTLNDCKGVVFSWLSRRLDPDTANNAFRILFSCKVNKVCPLSFEDTSAVVEACSGPFPSNSSCCSTVNNYILTMQKQMLITNKQALNCATVFGSMLQKKGVVTDIYELCDVDLKDFSLQATGQEGCLLRSLPTDVVVDSSSGVSFTCDLSDNIAAPWPSSSTLSSLSTCAAASLPALPTSETSGYMGDCGIAVESYLMSSLCILFIIFL